MAVTALSPGYGFHIDYSQNSEAFRAFSCGVTFLEKILSFDWRLRGAKPHPLGTLNDVLFAEACARLNQIIQLPT